MSDPRSVFGERAAFYTTSEGHRDPSALAELVALVSPRPAWRVLDLATGTGHLALAFAPHVAEVCGADITPQMLAEAEALAQSAGVANVRWVLADAHCLPFPDGGFDLVTCRRAAHHFSHLSRALAEVRRVLKADGRVLIEDRSCPDDEVADRVVNTLDVMHDPSHIREYGLEAWRQMLAAAGFVVTAQQFRAQLRPVSSFTTGLSESGRAQLVDFVSSLPAAEAQAIGVCESGGELHSNHWFVTLAAQKA